MSNMEVITSLDNKRIKNYAKLLNKKYRDEEGMFLVEGEHLVKMAIEAGNLETILVDENSLDKYLDIVNEDSFKNLFRKGLFQTIHY